MPSPKPPFTLTPTQLRRLSPHFPISHGVPRGDDRRVLSGVIYVIRHGLQWRDAPACYGPHKTTLYNRFVRSSCLGMFERLFAALAAERGPPDRLMISSAHLKPHRTAASLLKREFWRLLGRSNGGLNSKLHAACDGQGRPVVLLLTEG